MPQAEVFAGFELDRAAREIRRDGLSAPVQPKVFELLCYLIDHRDRVVTKRELLDRFWSGVVVSESAVAQVVKKARVAIGDDGEVATRIKTVPRVGYRFLENGRIGTSDLADAADHSNKFQSDVAANAVMVGNALRAARPSNRSVGLCVVPIDSRLPDLALAWVPLGLSSLIARAFEADPRFAVVPMVTMLQTLGSLGPSAPLEDRAAALSALLGADCVVTSVVEKIDNVFALSYRGHGPAGHGLSGRLESAEVTSLGQRLATAIERHVFPKTEFQVRFESRDPLANQAYARAVQASAEQKYASSLNLLEVVLEIEPHNTAAILLKLQVLMSTLDGRAQSVGEQLLRLASASGNRQLLAQTHSLIASASLGRNGPTSLAVSHAAAALALCGEGRTDSVSLLVYGRCAVIAQAQGNDASARALALHNLTQYEASGNRHAEARTQMVLAYCDVRESAYVEAGRRLEDSLAFFSEHGFRDTALFALSNLAGLVNARLGKWVTALRQSDQALESIKLLGGQPSAILPLANLSSIYAEFSRSADIERGLGLLTALPTEQSPHLYSALLSLRGQLAVARGDFAAAREPLRQALGLQRLLLAPASIQLAATRLLRNEMRAGCFAAAVTIADELLRDERRLPPDGEIKGIRLHARAAILHATADSPSARRVLAEAVDCLPAGDAQARARLDAAWLAIEGGALAEARSLLCQIPHWVREHPLGMATGGRLAWAEGKPDRALAALDDCTRSTATVWPALAALRNYYVHSTTADGADAPALPRLLTTLPEAVRRFDQRG